MTTTLTGLSEGYVPENLQNKPSKQQLKRKIWAQEKACLEDSPNLSKFLKLISLTEDLAAMHQRDGEFDEAVRIYGSVAETCERCRFYPEAVFALNMVYMLLPEGNPERDEIVERIEGTANRLEGKSMAEAINAYKLVMAHLAEKKDMDSEKRLAQITYRVDQMESLVTLTEAIMESPNNPLLWAKFATTHRFFDNSREELVAHEMAIGHAHKVMEILQIRLQKHLTSLDRKNKALEGEELLSQGVTLAEISHAHLIRHFDECHLQEDEMKPLLVEALDRLCARVVQDTSLFDEDVLLQVKMVSEELTGRLAMVMSQQTKIPESLTRETARKTVAALQKDLNSYLLLEGYAKAMRACTGILTYSKYRKQGLTQTPGHQAN